MSYLVPIWACTRLDARLQTENLDRCERRILRTLHSHDSVRIQGLSIFPTDTFATYPHHVIALALITQAAPCDDLLDNLIAQPVNTAVILGRETPLLDVLDHQRLSATSKLRLPQAQTTPNKFIVTSSVSTPALPLENEWSSSSRHTRYVVAVRITRLAVRSSRRTGSLTALPGS